jgi:ABC-2 type transport system ATP-binding protein
LKVSCVLTDEELRTTLAVRGRRITKYFGDVVALDGVDLDVEIGQIHGLVGPNGAGKTTLLGILLGLALADQGTLEVLGQPAGRALQVPDGVAGFIDGPGVYPSLTARRNLAELARLRGYGAKADIDDALAQVGLSDVANDKVRGFSLGMRQRIGLAAALLIRPRLLILDEPSNGLDPTGRKRVHGVLRRLAADGTAVLLSSHQMDDLEALCSEVTIVAAGRVVFSGSLSKLADECRPVDYRLRTSDPTTARHIGDKTSGVTVQSAPRGNPGPDMLVIRANVPAIDALIPKLLGAGVAVRELTPVISPLESAFLALTQQHPAESPEESPARLEQLPQEPSEQQKASR